MLRLIRLEFYKLFHSRSMAILILALLLMSVMISKVSIAHTPRRELMNVYAVKISDVSDSGDVNEAMKDVKRLGYNAKESHGYYWFDSKAIGFFRSGGELYEKYKNSDFINKLEPLQMVDYIMLEADETNGYAKGIFFKALDDPSAIAFSSIIFAIFFIGLDYRKRTYNGAVYYGTCRIKILTAKIITYIFISALISLLELITAFYLYCPEVFSLPLSFTLKYMFVRICIDIGMFSCAVIFTVVFKNMFIAMGTYFLLFFMFMSNRSLIYLNPYKWNDLDIYRYGLDTDTILHNIVATVLILLVSSIVSIIIFRKAKLR